MKDLGVPPEHLKSNPFFHFYEKTHFVPAWDRIKPCHVLPAFEYALNLAHENLQKIIDNNRQPGFINTVEALENSDELARYFAGILFNIIPRNKNEEIRYEMLYREISGQYHDYYKKLFGSDKIYQRLLAVRESARYTKLTRAQKYLHESYENGFIDSGIKLSDQNKDLFYKLQEQIADLEITSQKNMVRAETETLVVFSRPKDLDGLPAFARTQAATKAQENGHKGKWAFALDEETYAVFIESVHKRTARERLYRAYHTRATKGRYNNCETIIALNRLYQKRARILGYRSMADMELGSHMALKPGTVGKFLKLLRRIALPQAKKEMAELKDFANDTYRIKNLQPWDVPYIKERLKKKILGFDNEELRPYFEMETVLKGTFEHFKKLYGLHFIETDQYPVYHKDVRAFQVTNARTGTHMGVLFLDLFARDQKPAGTAWSVPIVSQGLFQGKLCKSVNIIVMKLSKPTRNAPALLCHDDIQTLFHEMGHATHDILSKVRYQSQAGTNVEHDFLEFPSQIEENWTFEPEVLDRLARHYRTGETLPDEIKEKLRESRVFMSASRVMAYVRRGWLDLAWAETNAGKVKNVASFEKRVLKDFMWSPQYGEMISPSFSHIFGGGYEMSFYGYQWSEALAADAYSLFEQKGLYNSKTAARLKKLKQQGGSKDSGVLYKEFRHRCAQMTSFFTRVGLLIQAVISMDTLYSPRRTAGAAPAIFHKRRRLHRGRF
ncbi:MAG: hypothetical protein CO093_06725 [Alphaproteobacteria bacterium CG_4_9_14_3_um_filter_47_13]|nr:MAG: hypothetical protein CO093_06725 [Alphaproteobacteria bacterium CG_4_9_14_3_um_filter_47_13]